MGKISIHHIGITVKDLAKSIEFYTIQLGYQLKERYNSKNNVEIAFLRNGEDLLELICYQGSDMAGTVHLAFEVDDFELEVNKLLASSVKVITPEPVDVLNGGKMFLFKGADDEELEYFLEPPSWG